MSDLREIKDQEQAENYFLLCEQGKCSVVKTFIKGNPELVIVSKSGVPQAIVGKRHKFKFDGFMLAAGRGDGLWPGFDQTASRA
ncbi:MAG: hypothetical protein WDN46_17380 [Methylocella sp.]